jgi:hypothetical protein
MKNTLTAKVRARNYVNSQIREIAPKMIEALKPLVGKKIILATGELSAEAKKILKPFLVSTPKLQIYRFSSNYNLVYIFKTSENDSEFSCVYQENSVYLGKIGAATSFGSNEILESLHDFNPTDYPIDFEAENILNTRKEIESLKSKISKLENNLAGFGLYDN